VAENRGSSRHDDAAARWDNSPGERMNRNLRVGIFTAVGVGAIIGFSIYVNDHPYWYRPCNEVKIYTDDATGLRRKSPVKTLGLDIGYIKEVDLEGNRVLIRVCVTGPVRLNADTRPYIKSSGFLGDKFLELKPVDKIAEPGEQKKPHGEATQPVVVPKAQNNEQAPATDPGALPAAAPAPGKKVGMALKKVLDLLIPEARAEETTTLNASREAELQDTVKKVGKLVDQLTLMVGDLREVTQQKEFKETVMNINAAMKHLELLLRPTGKVMKNVDQAMESLRNTMASAEAVLGKIKDGEGTIGKFVNDPTLYDDLRAAIQSVNLLLGKAGLLRTFVDIGAWEIPAYRGARASFKVMIQPNPGRYYLIGISNDPRGLSRTTTTTDSVNGQPPSTEVKTVNEERGLRLTAMFGKYFGPLDLSIGLLEDYGAVGAGFWFDSARRYGIHADLYSLGKSQPVTARVYARAQLISSLYISGGIDQIQKFPYTEPNGTQNKRLTYFFGGGLFFDDDDLKYLLVFK
jgi:phospholipid/cholesterol/gamma-HCH transport system substrate-binding protein